MAKPVLPHKLGNCIEPLLPVPKTRRFRFPGRKPISNRKSMTSILFVLRSGIRWEDLPREPGFGRCTPDELRPLSQTVVVCVAPTFVPTVRGTPNGSGWGRYRWIVEPMISWFHRPWNLRLRKDWREDIHEALSSLCCSLMRWNIFTSSFC